VNFEETELDLLLSPWSKDRMLTEKVNGKAYKFEGIAVASSKSGINAVQRLAW
jgi:hypothetical protein